MEMNIASVLRCTQGCIKKHSCASAKKKKGKKSFYYMDSGCSGNKTNTVLSRRCCRTAWGAAGRQPAQPDCVEVTFVQLSQTHGASTQENAASALQQSQCVTPSALAGLLQTPADMRKTHRIFKTRLAVGKHSIHEPFM